MSTIHCDYCTVPGEERGGEPLRDEARIYGSRSRRGSKIRCLRLDDITRAIRTGIREHFTFPCSFLSLSLSLSRTRARARVNANKLGEYIIIHAEEGGRPIPPEGYSGARYLVFFSALEIPLESAGSADSVNVGPETIQLRRTYDRARNRITQSRSGRVCAVVA